MSPDHNNDPAYLKGEGRTHVPLVGTSTIAMNIPAKVSAPKAYFAIDGQCFAFLPVEAPKVEAVRIFRTRRQ